MTISGFFHKSKLVGAVPISTIPKCGQCGLYISCNSPKMPVTGKGLKKILIVGEAPGETEDSVGRQFCGRTGKLLEEILSKFGIHMRNDCWLTNAIICRPTDNRTPTNSEISYCRPNIIKTIKELEPHIILLCGGQAVNSVISWLWKKDDTGKIGRWVGWKIPAQKINAWVVPVWHPSYIARQDGNNQNPEADVIWKRHIEDFSKLSGRPWDVVPNYEKEVKLIFDITYIKKAIEDIIQRGGYAAFDFECTSLKPEWDRARIVCASICSNGEHTIAFPWFDGISSVFREFIRSPIKKIASNIKYEERWCRYFLKKPVNNWWHCTMTAAHILDNRREITGLKFQSFVWLGQESYDSHIKPFLMNAKNSKINRIKEVELNELMLYCGLDSILEYHVSMKQRKELGYEY